MSSRRHDDSDEDTYVMVGSAFEPLETEEDVEKAKRKKDKEHYVTDAQGRRRFHGAFTGGFSAGYFNTVGTKEGWAPSTFISSRDKKADRLAQRPEDFMDDEDLGEHGIAPREIAAKEKFTEQDHTATGTKRPLPPPLASGPTVIPGVPPLQNLVVPAKSTIGARLLKKMGWREGQGVGPKVERRWYMYATTSPVQHQSDTVVSSEASHVTTTATVEKGSSSSKHTHAHREGHGGQQQQRFMFAPLDVLPWEFEPKDDLHGIGYQGMEDRGVLRSQETSHSVYGMSGQAFGTGALEEEEDEDIYGQESLTTYDTALALEGEVAAQRTYGWTGGTADSDSWGLACFLRSRKSRVEAKKYPPPDVPRGFVPFHKFSLSATPTPATGSSDRPEPSDKCSKPLNRHQRAQLLAEPGEAPPSVFSLLSPVDRDRLKHASEKAQQMTHESKASLTPPSLPPSLPPSFPPSLPPSLLASLPPSLPPTFPPSLPPSLPASLPPSLPPSFPPSLPPSLPPSTSQSETPKSFTADTFRPFAKDPAKQQRYEAFLAGKNLPGLDRMTEWERGREREEFSRAARVCQPLGKSLDNRFTRGTTGGVLDEGEKEKSDAVQAAEVKMFGVLTRQVQDWHPHSLVCKRFNVPDPYPNSSHTGVKSDSAEAKRKREKKVFVSGGTEGTPTTTPSVSMATPLSMPPTNIIMGASSTKPVAMETQRPVVAMETQRPALEQLKVAGGGRGGGGGGERKGEGEGGTELMQSAGDKEKSDEEDEPERPPMDLFKSIFASDEDDKSSSDSEEEGGEGALDVMGVARGRGPAGTVGTGAPVGRGPKWPQGAGLAGPQGAGLTAAGGTSKQWQDLAVAATKPLPLPRPLPHPLHSQEAHQVQVDIKGVVDVAQREVEGGGKDEGRGSPPVSYGPTLPSVFRNDPGNDKADELASEHTSHKSVRKKHKEKRDSHHRDKHHKKKRHHDHMHKKSKQK